MDLTSPDDSFVLLMSILAQSLYNICGCLIRRIFLLAHHEGYRTIPLKSTTSRRISAMQPL